ncbi:hypothetical protein Rhe02_72630 [Rhizocola hellebori]|uniref:Uncharacterized protein n=2 Tax=Rhizocola hellebori TaxID=1392758 RepID=A0A8J3QED7_9ACTN|nr:hypothetical protein Rhe02_72630 [Rhizocola hellebori]
MVVGGLAVLAAVRPWRPDPEEDEPEAVVDRVRPAPRPKRPRPRPGSARPASGAPKRHRVEVISRARRVPPEPGREEILLPEWLGPVSGPR